MKNTISITEARKDIFNLIEEISLKNERYLLTEKGRAKAVLMSAEEFDAWQETLAVVDDFPTLDKDIEIAYKEYSRNEFVTLDSLLAQQGYIVADKARNNEIPNNPSKNRRKKA